MRTLHVSNLLRKAAAGCYDSHRQWVTARCFIMLAIVGLVIPALIRPNAVGAQCRITSQLNLMPDILTRITVQKQGDRLYDIHLFLNTNRHIQLCPGSAFLPICNYDGFSLRPGLVSSNVSSITPFSPCNQESQVITSDTSSFTMGWRCKFEQDFVSTQLQNPAGKTFQLPVPAGLAVGDTLDTDAGQLQVTTVQDDPNG